MKCISICVVRCYFTDGEVVVVGSVDVLKGIVLMYGDILGIGL